MNLKSRSASGLPLLLASYVALVACSGGHDHDHDHDHGEGHVHVAPHADEGGVLVELGDHFANAEFVLDPEGGRLTMYTYGGHAKKSVRSPSASVTVSLDMHGDAPLVVELAAQESKLSGETVGDSSMFMGADPGLVGVSHFHGKIHALSVLGMEFTDVKFDYDLPSEDHDGGDHDGGDHDGGDHDGEDHEDHDHDGEGHDGEGDGDHGE
jgi:hypothetical protein